MPLLLFVFILTSCQNGISIIGTDTICREVKEVVGVDEDDINVNVRIHSNVRSFCTTKEMPKVYGRNFFGTDVLDLHNWKKD